MANAGAVSGSIKLATPDSNGYSIDARVVSGSIADYVLNALNRDMSFDRFTIEQLAGDMLRCRYSHKIATGFHRNTQINEEGGIDKERRQGRSESHGTRRGCRLARLTVGCAQCHDHKFDPLSQKEYYQLYSFFNQSDDPKTRS
jgi:hypothetical protein